MDIHLDPQHLRRLEEIAGETGKSVEEVLRELLDRVLGDGASKAGPEGRRTRTVSAGFEQAGLIGALKDAPADLSTNPEYFEGFGRG